MTYWCFNSRETFCINLLRTLILMTLSRRIVMYRKKSRSIKYLKGHEIVCWSSVVEKIPADSSCNVGAFILLRKVGGLTVFPRSPAATLNISPNLKGNCCVLNHSWQVAEDTDFPCFHGSSALHSNQVNLQLHYQYPSWKIFFYVHFVLYSLLRLMISWPRFDRLCTTEGKREHVSRILPFAEVFWPCG